MISDAQLSATAVRLLDQHLADLLDPAYETADWIDKALCEHCATGDCQRADADADREIARVQDIMRGMVAQLRQHLTTLTAS